jgi:hypothetical protein
VLGRVYAKKLLGLLLEVMELLEGDGLCFGLLQLLKVRALMYVVHRYMRWRVYARMGKEGLLVSKVLRDRLGMRVVWNVLL